MDSSTQKDNSPEAIRERVESRSEEYAGGPSSGWQTLEETVDEVRQGGGELGTATMQSSAAVTSGDTETDTVDTSSTEVIRGVDSPEEMPPFNDEHPIGVGQQCYKCGAYNDLEAETCWNCGEELSRAMVETPGVGGAGQTADTGDTIESVWTDGTTANTEGARPISPS
jgi:hypothetical protein